MKKRITLSTPVKYAINILLVVVLLAGGSLLYGSGLLNRASKAILILVLLIKPSGLLGKGLSEKV